MKRVYDFTQQALEERPREEEREERRQQQRRTEAALAPEQLTVARDQIRTALETLDLQLAEIRKRVYGEGKPENARWRSNATGAERQMSKHRVRLQEKLGEIHRLIRQDNKRKSDAERKPIDGRFIQLARAHLSDDVWRALWDQVNTEYGIKK